MIVFVLPDTEMFPFIDWFHKLGYIALLDSLPDRHNADYHQETHLSSYSARANTLATFDFMSHRPLGSHIGYKFESNLTIVHKVVR